MVLLAGLVSEPSTVLINVLEQLDEKSGSLSYKARAYPHQEEKEEWLAHIYFNLARFL